MTTDTARDATAIVRPAKARPRPAGLSMRQREALAGYIFVAPDFLGLLIFIGVPMTLALTMGFFNVNGFGAFTWAGFDNYKKMLIDPVFWQCLKVTALYVVLIVPALYVTGLALALLVQRTSKFNTVMRAMFFAPQMVSLVVIAVIWQMMSADKQGILARAFSAIGIPNVSLLGNPNIVLYTVVFIAVWFLMGFYMMIFLGGLQDIPKEYYEAAEIDGASKVHRFWYITLPLLKPTSFFIILTSLVAAVAGGQAFDLIYVMTKGGPANATQLVVVYIYQQAFQFGAFGYAAAMASILVVILLLVTGILFFMTRGGRFSYD